MRRPPWYLPHTSSPLGPPLGQALSCLLAALCLVCHLSSQAQAERLDSQDIPCGLVEVGNIHVDGLISDWDGVEAIALPVRPGPGAGAAGKPHSVQVRCNYEPGVMYLLIDVRDDMLVRTPAAGMGEDHLELAFATSRANDAKAAKAGTGAGARLDRLLFWPAVYSAKVRRAARWSSGRPLSLIDGEGPAGRLRPRRGPPAIEVYEAQQPQGFLVEMRLPLRLLPGYRPGVPLPMGIRVVDVDSRAKPEPVAVSESCALDAGGADGLSQVLFAEAQAGLEALLSDMGAGRSDIWWERSADLGGGPARVLLIGRSLAVVSKEYGYQDVALSRADIKDVQLVPIGEGRQALALRVSESGGGGSRTILRLYRVQGGAIKAIFAAEVEKAQGTSRLTVEVKHVPRGKEVDLVLTPRPAVGFTPDTYRESPAEDVVPILLPWGGPGQGAGRPPKARFVLRNGAYVRSE
jgi:hypothetical protein